MQARKPASPQFYAGDCVRQTARFLRNFTPNALPERIVAGIVPHAGWIYSGAVAAQVFENIRCREYPSTFVFFGTGHRWTGNSAVYARGAWSTPLGDIIIDEELAEEILKDADGLAEENPAAHDDEHSIEVELPFVKHLFPEAKLVPISVRSDESAVPLGEIVANVIKKTDRPVAIIGSTDLTHYGDDYRFTPAGYGHGALEWMKANDARILRLAEQMQADTIVEEGLGHHNACGPGALAATVAAARKLGADRGYLIDYTTSFDADPERDFTMGVGYAAILY